MSNKPLAIKSPEFKALARQKTKLWRELDESRAPHPGIDHIQDQWGTYVPMDKVKKLLDMMDQLAGVDDKEESRGSRYSRAALLLTLNLLDQAEKEFKLLVDQNPEETSWSSSLVVIAARRGKLEEARRIANIVNTSSHTFFHMSEERILEEFERHGRLIKPDQS
ncbi:hypothetical protein ACO0LG_19405 [Undibacterium sp. Ji42W]|uniref:hypothetical protein n=1 Tax=Undibacterium sp. Ji42W TaxID=3413039 RepID=UPI003BF3037B